MKVKAFNKQMF